MMNDGGDGGGRLVSKEELAGRAHNSFEAGDFGKAVDTLEKLAADPVDPKVMHNLAVARYYLNKATSASVSKFFIEIQAAKRTMSRQEDSDNGDDFEDDETDSAVICYNLAVVHYQRREFDQAHALLDRLFKVIEAIEETIARKICLLLLDVYMVQYQPENAGFILQYLERTLNGSHAKEKDDEKGGKSSANHTNNNSNNTSNSNNNNNNDKDSVASNPGLELLKFQLHQYRARIYIISRSMKACKREIKSALNFSNQSATALFLKSNFEYARRNYRKAIKLLNSCPKNEPHVSGQSLATMYYNNLGCVHFQMHKHALASVYFNKATTSNEQEAGRKTMADATHEPLKTLISDRIHELMYNQGLNFLFMKKPEMATVCFKASMLLFSSNPRYWLRLAECCIQYHEQNEEAAASHDASAYFRKCGSAQNTKIVVIERPKETAIKNPSADLSLTNGIMYLRTALALLDASSATNNNTNNTTNNNDNTDTTDTTVNVAATTTATPTSTSTTTAATPTTTTPSPPEETTVKTSSVQTTSPTPATGPPKPSVSFALPGTHTSPIQETDVAIIRCHILTNLAYCYLGEGDFTGALNVTDDAISDQDCPGPLRFLAHLYAAESLIRTRKLAQAIRHLGPENIGDLSSGTERDEGDEKENGGDAESTREPVQTITAESAKIALFLNLASAYAIKQEYDQCLSCLSQVKALQPGAAAYRKVTLMSIYALLCQNKSVEALQIVEQNKLPF